MSVVNALHVSIIQHFENNMHYISQGRDGTKLIFAQEKKLKNPNGPFQLFAAEINMYEINL